MKTDAPKRKIFTDAVDLLSPGKQATGGSGVEMLDIDASYHVRYRDGCFDCFRAYGSRFGAFC